jgi:ABC-2 type transport system permease protein
MKSQFQSFIASFRSKFQNLINNKNSNQRRVAYTDVNPFGVIVKKEVADCIHSWRFIIMVILIALTCFGSVYTALSSFSDAVKNDNSENAFFFLKLFTASDKSMPSFIIFIGFLGPLLGLILGFDSINHEQNKGTLSRMLAQPIPRDYVLNAKFVASLVVVSSLFLSLGLMVMGIGLIAIGIPPTAEEFIRIILFLILSSIYVSLWINLSIFFSVLFRQPATSALAGIAVWLFFTVFYPLIISFIFKSIEPSASAMPEQILHFERTKLFFMQLMPNELFSEATSTLLMPTIRSIGPLTVEQMYGSIPAPLPLTQSLMVVFPQIIGLIAGSVICFVLSYVTFMRKEIRSR